MHVEPIGESAGFDAGSIGNAGRKHRQAFWQLKLGIRIGKTQEADELLSLGLGCDTRADNSGSRIHIEAPLACLLQLAPVAGLHHAAPKLSAGLGRDLHLFHVLGGLLRGDGSEIRAPGLRGDI